jgi:hypothetical protein
MEIVDSRPVDSRQDLRQEIGLLLVVALEADPVVGVDDRLEKRLRALRRCKAWRSRDTVSVVSKWSRSGPTETSNGGWCVKTAMGLVVSASISSIKRLTRSGQKSPLLLPELRVSSAISLTG